VTLRRVSISNASCRGINFDAVGKVAGIGGANGFADMTAAGIVDVADAALRWSYISN